jgi:PAS domain S-box-containing protein
MKNQSDTSLQIRLASIAIICLFIALGAVAYFSGQQVKRDSEAIAKDAVPGTIAAHNMRMAMSRSIGWVMVAAFAQTTESRDASLKTVHDADVDFANDVAQYQATIKIDPAKDQALLDEVTRQFAKYQQQRLAYEALILAGDRDKSAAFLENELVPAYASAITAGQQLLNYNHANSMTYADRIRGSVNQLYWAAAIVMVLAIVCALVLIVNLSIRRREVRELRESEELFRTSFENATVGVCLVSTGGRFLKTNRTLCAMLGYSEDELLQLTFNDVTHEEDREVGQKFLKGALSGGPKTMQTEKRYLRKDGQVVWAYLSTALIDKSPGKDAYMISYIQDITERKRATEQLEMLKVSIDRHFDGAYWMDTNNRFVYVNDSACKALGYTREELLGQPVTLIAPLATPQRMQEVWKSLRETGFFTRESRHRRKDGREFPIELVASYVRFEGKEFNCSFARDITERIRAQAALVALQSHQERTLSALGEGLQVIDRNGIIIYENPAAAAMLGWEANELIGRFGHDLIHHSRADGSHYPQAECKILATLLDGVPRRVDDEVFWRKDGTSFPVAYICTAMRDETGEIDEIVVAFRDITERKRLEKKQNELAAIVASSDDAIIGKSLDGIITSWNRGAEKVFGYSAAEASGQPILMLIPADRQHEEAVILEKIKSGEAVEHFETVRLRKDGQPIHVSVTISPLRDGSGRVIGASKIARDITEQKQAEVRIQRLNRTYAVISGINQTILHVRDPQAVLEAACRIAVDKGKLRMSWAGKFDAATQSIIPIASAGVVEGYMDLLNINLHDETRNSGPAAQCVRSGQYVICNDIAHDPIMAPWRDAALQRGYRSAVAFPLKVEGEIIGIFNLYSGDADFFDKEELLLLDEVADDIGFALEVNQNESKRKRAESELRATNARYTRQEAALIALTRACAQRQANIPEIKREVAQIAADTLEVERVSIWRYQRARESLLCQELFCRSNRSHAEGTSLSGGDFPAYFRALADGNVIAAHDAYRDPRTTEFSETYLRPLGISSMLDTPIHVMGVVTGVICCEQVGPARQWAADEQTFALAVANLVSLLLAEEERQQIEGQLRQAQKMEAIGTLAGGIAHDFNNILAAIIGYTEMAKRRAANDPTVVKYLEAVFQAGTRAVSLVKQILTFSRPREAQERKPIEIGTVVQEPLKLLRASIPSNIEFEVSLDANLPSVLADATQVHQIVMNLCTNAAHAMKDRPGRLGVRLEKFTVDKFLAGANAGLRTGPYVRLSVSDTGHGMSRATIVRIFEPFFTTKGPGEGTGLGLSVVHGIMQSHGGAITVYSQPGEGTVFHLYFPITAEENKEAAAITEEAPVGHGERILFVDDEIPLALLGQSMLEELGYVVENKNNVVEALALVRANPAAFDLVITDLTMPLMVGTDFAQQLLALRPGLPIILTTGYSASLTPERVREMGIRELLLKPHTIQSLGMAVHRVLTTQPKT